MVGKDGTIVLPFIGKVQAANLTVSQLTGNLNVLFSKYVNHPMITVHLIENGKQPRYYVDGGVVQPGQYVLVSPVTILETIDKAEGFRRAAHNHKIVILRQGGPGLYLDYKGLLKHPERNVILQNGDHVIVPQ